MVDISYMVDHRKIIDSEDWLVFNNRLIYPVISISRYGRWTGNAAVPLGVWRSEKNSRQFDKEH